MSSKNIIIIPGCTDLNRGDQALVWETASVIKDAVPDAVFSVLESGTKKEDIHLQSRQTQALGYKITPKILKHPSRITQKNEATLKYSKTDYLLWGFQGIIDLFYTLLLLSRFSVFNKLGNLFLNAEQKETLQDFKNSHAVAVKGGGFIHAYGNLTGLYTMYFSLYHVLLAIRYRKDVIIFPNSIGPVKGFFTRKLVKHVLKNCKLVTVREKVSHKYLEESLNIKAELYPDLGFYLEPKDKDYTEYLLKNNIPVGQKKLVGITLRPYRFPNSPDPEERYKSYISEIVKFVDLAISNNFHVLFSAHTLGPSTHEDDRLAIKDVLQKLPENLKSGYSYIEDFDLDCKDVMGLYSHLDFMAGTRFHSVIFAFNVNVPCIAIAYGGNKSFGIMSDMDLLKYVDPIENFQGARFYELMSEATGNKEEYIDKIKKYRIYLTNARDELQGKLSLILNK